MRSLQVTGTAIDLATQNSPFDAGSTVVAINFSAESDVVVQGSVDEAFTVPVDLATLAARGVSGSVQEVTLTYQYVRVNSYDGVAQLTFLAD